MKVDIIVLNYNGKKLIEKCLPSICEAAEASSYKCRVHVVDNLSSDDSIGILETGFPQVIIHKAKENKVLCSYNEVVNDMDSDIVILLNNDIRVEPDFIDPLVMEFEDESVLFVAPKILDFKGENMDGGPMDVCFRFGRYKDRFKLSESTRYTLFVGSSAAYDRRKYMELGGYDDLYLPGTYEDLDLCYRGWQKGWTGIYAERSVVYHIGSASFDNEYGNKKRQRLSARNANLFVWKNMRDLNILAENILFFPIFMLFNLCRLRLDLFLGSWDALKALFKALCKRREFSKNVKLTHKEICAFIQGKNKIGGK